MTPPVKNLPRAPTPSQTEAAEKFARWLEEGPKLAGAAGLYVGIKVTAAKPKTTA